MLVDKQWSLTVKAFTLWRVFLSMLFWMCETVIENLRALKRIRLLGEGVLVIDRLGVGVRGLKYYVRCVNDASES